MMALGPGTLKPSLDAAIWRAAKKKGRDQAIAKQERIRDFAIEAFGIGSTEYGVLMAAYSVEEWTSLYAHKHAEKAIEQLLKVALEGVE